MSTVRQYFDLNQPVALGRAHGRAPPVAGKARDGGGEVAPEQLTLGWQIVTYLILVASIVSSRFLDLFRAGATASFSLDWRYLLFLAITSLAAFPVVYDKARTARDQPLFLKIVVIFTAGMGWEKIIATAVGK